jgi:hypothetical protein
MRLSAANSGGGLPSPKNRNALEPGPACTPGRTEGHDSLQATRECVKAVTDAHRRWSWRVHLLSRLAGSKSLVPHNAQNSTESHLDYAVHNRMICTSLSSRRTSNPTRVVGARERWLAHGWTSVTGRGVTWCDGLGRLTVGFSSFAGASAGSAPGSQPVPRRWPMTTTTPSAALVPSSPIRNGSH